jgi:adenine-specific DNA-methyltransferase
MQNLLEELKLLLSEDERLVIEGKLFKNKVIELGLNCDASLLKLLLKNEKIKRHFFTEVDGFLVFDKIKFQRFVSNKEFLPDSFTAFKNKIGLANEDGEYLSESKEVVLSWPYKDCILEGGQTKEDQKRDEIFYNETLAPDEIDRLQEKAFLSYKVDVRAINENITEFEGLSFDEQKKFLIEILDKNQLYVNYSEIEDEDYNISVNDKKLNKKFYGG